jgi:hypothetical protein
MHSIRINCDTASLLHRSSLATWSDGVARRKACARTAIGNLVEYYTCFQQHQLAGSCKQASKSERLKLNITNRKPKRLHPEALYQPQPILLTPNSICAELQRLARTGDNSNCRSGLFLYLQVAKQPLTTIKHCSLNSDSFLSRYGQDHVCGHVH